VSFDVSAFTTVNGLTFHHRSDGNPRGIPLVLIHALGTDLRIWDDVVGELSNRFRVFRYDLRGHGLSDAPRGPYSLQDNAPDLLGLLDTVESETPILVGTSVGGQIALEFALEQPHRVRALVLCDTALKLGADEFWNDRIQKIKEQGLAFMADKIVPRWFAPSFAKLHSSAYQGYLNMLGRTSADGYIAMCEALREADFTNRLGSLTMPTLVMTGTFDVSAPPSAARALTEAIPNAQFELVGDAGHMTCIEQPRVVAQSIQQFLQAL
jgi:3-oxoadipate enol-lactonase